MYIVLFALAILSLILIPLAPMLVRLRIGILRWLHWNWAVNLLEKHFNAWVLFFRIFLLVIAAVLLYIGWEDLRDRHQIDAQKKGQVSLIDAGSDATVSFIDKLVTAAADRDNNV